MVFYLTAKQPDRAMQKLNSNPDDHKQAFHYELMGVVAAELGKRQEVENADKRALEKDPHRAMSKQFLFQQYLQSNRLDEAIRMLDAQLKNNPSNAAALAERGDLYDAQGKTDLARLNYEQALQIDPNQVVAANNLAFLLAEQGQDLDTALKYAQVVRNPKPDDPFIADTLGWVYYKMGRPVLARDAAQFAVSKDPHNPSFEYHLGMIYRAANQRSEAERALKKAIASSRAFKEKSDAEAALKDIDHWRHLVSSNKITSVVNRFKSLIPTSFNTIKKQQHGM